MPRDLNKGLLKYIKGPSYFKHFLIGTFGGDSARARLSGASRYIYIIATGCPIILIATGPRVYVKIVTIMTSLIIIPFFPELESSSSVSSSGKYEGDQYKGGKEKGCSQKYLG